MCSLLPKLESCKKCYTNHCHTIYEHNRNLNLLIFAEHSSHILHEFRRFAVLHCFTYRGGRCLGQYPITGSMATLAFVVAAGGGEDRRNTKLSLGLRRTDVVLQDQSLGPCLVGRSSTG
jgi:hypothetical protein